MLERKTHRAKKLVRSLIKHNFHQGLAANEIGISQQALSQAIKNNPLVQSEFRKALEKISPKNEISSEFVLRNLLEDRHLAINFRDITNAVRVDEFFAKYLKMVSDMPAVNINIGDRVLSNYMDVNELEDDNKLT